jgi:thioredoxin reductase (NADPH)
LWDSVIEEVLGKEENNKKTMTGVKIRNVKTNAVTDVKADGLFIAIGHVPNTSVFKGKIDVDEKGYIKTKAGSTATNVPGVFAAGDVTDAVYRQAITAAGSGCMAAIDAERWLEANHD